MNQIKDKLIQRARQKYKVILPPNTKTDLSDCFTTEGRRVCFWFNTSDNSTHVLVSEPWAHS